MAFYVFSHRTTTGFSLRVRADTGGCAFTATQAGTAYRGQCRWVKSGHVLEIHEVSAQPEGKGLGAILMWVASRRARPSRLDCPRLATTATATTAYRFYRDLGLHPSPDEKTHRTNMIPLAVRPSGGPGKEEFAIRLLIGRMATATWSGEREHVEVAAWRSFDRAWDVTDIEE